MAIGAETERVDAGRRSHLAHDLSAAAVLGVLAVVAVGPSPLLLGLLYLAAVTAELVRIDVDSHRLPNRLVLPGYPIALAGVAFHGVLTGIPPVLPLAAGAAWFLFFLVLNLGGGMGMGDVKLAGVLGLCLGSIGPGQPLIGLALAFLFGGIAGILVLVRHVGGRNARIPFGPFLLAGFWVAVALAPAASV
ncbi:A24 family peptidase [Mycetocola sp. 2940]|uniref:A24 family peptidase n=1 Tax=Mycetocola sp. 2940 TaxID=3156452 RepID=UPI0033922763